MNGTAVVAEGRTTAKPSARAGGGRARGVARRVELWAPAALAAAVAATGLTRVGPWMDEGYSYAAVHRSFPELWRMLGRVDAVHGAYYLTMRLVLLATGAMGHPAAALAVLRGVSAAAVALAAAGVAAVAVRLAGSRRAGLAAGLLYAVTPMVTRYAQEARSYALVSLCAVTGVWLLARALERPERRRRWAAAGAALALGTVLHLFAVLLVPALTAGLAVVTRRRAVWRGWALACGIALAAAGAMGAVCSTESAAVSWIEPPHPGNLLGLVKNFGGPGRVDAAAMTLLAAAGLTLCRRGRRRAGRTTLLPLAAAWLVLPPLLLLAVSLADPLYNIRYVFYALPGLSVLAGAGLDATAARAAALLTRRQPALTPLRVIPKPPAPPTPPPAPAGDMSGGDAPGGDMPGGDA
ncbi:glycosyltransferase family 39 protein, partial [Mangrovactinospora gilvigrisea]|uniref:glycosyltransferase family 39 protein n=1 Tax=Mangrovactinospora gilvigrisea TaxID=1428644 RepID=UPI001114A6E5